MPRLTFSGLQAEIAALLPDNTSGEISPADVRGVVTDIIDTFQPAGAGIYRTADASQALTTADTKLTVFDTTLTSFGESGVIIPSAANDTIDTLLIGVHTLSVNLQAEGGANDDLIVTVYRNGVPTAVAGEIALRGAGNKVEFTLSFPMQAPSPGPHEFSLYVRLRSGTGNVTFSNAIFTLTYIPGQ
jgi:hypothetical protein